MGQVLSYLGSAPIEEATLLAPSMQGNVDEVKRLVGTFIADSSGSKRSAAHENSSNKNDGLAAYVDRVDASGNAAIHGATFGGHLEVLTFLVESCHASLTQKNGLGCSPLWVAAGYDRIDCLEYLIKKLSGTERGDSGEGATSSNLSLALMDANNSGDTPFLAAASRGNVASCKVLFNSIDRCYGGVPENGSPKISCLELKQKMLRTSNQGGDTPLSVAVSAGHEGELLNLLLDADKEIAMNAKLEPVGEKDENSLESLCLSRKNSKGLTPLIVACERNFESIVEKLLQYDAELNVRDSNGRNPLAVASFCGCDDVVKFLLQHIKKDQSSTSSCQLQLLNEVDSLGCTPVWLAARTGNASMVKILVEAGADLTIRNGEGLTPQEVAMKFNKETVTSFLSEKMAQ